MKFKIELKSGDNWTSIATMECDNSVGPKGFYNESQRVIKAIRNAWIEKPSPKLDNFRVGRI